MKTGLLILTTSLINVSDFIKYMWREYQKDLKIKSIREKRDEMVLDSKKLNAEAMKAKYGDV